MENQLLKITYHLGDKKINAYLTNPSRGVGGLRDTIDYCLFEERKLNRCEIRVFWIDQDNDEIEIINNSDYEVFRLKNHNMKHIQVAPVNMAVEETDATAAKQTSTASESNQAKIPPAAGSYDFAVHDHVECDSCLMSPIIGFRYKCIQCSNYDLCQNCESKHMHSEHMMVRMPTNNCPSVVEAYVTGRNSGRRHGKRSKTTCPFVKNGLSFAIDDNAEASNSAGGENIEEPSPSSGKERHHVRRNHRRSHRNNFFSHLYEMMNDLAEGDGETATAYAMGESAASSNTTTPNNKEQTSTSATDAANHAATSAKKAAQQAHETAVKVHEVAAKVAHDTALKAAKNVVENMAVGCSASASTSAGKADEKEKETTKEKIDATTTKSDAGPQPTSIPVLPSPTMESLAQFLDPQYVKTGIQILNNFSDMFAKMLDPIENGESGQNPTSSNVRKNSDASTQSSASSKTNSLGSEKQSTELKSMEKVQIQENGKFNATSSNNSSQVEMEDLGSDSENESATESFVKLYAPKNANMITPPLTTASSAQTTPPLSLDKSCVVDFAQLSADLKAHIAQETAEDAVKTVETPIEFSNEPTAVVSTTTATEPVVTTTTSNKERRAIPVYHSDQRINNAINAMMSMGFSNEGACLTQLLESVNGDIPEALDIMSAAQRR